MATQLWTNNARSNLSAGIGSGDTSLSVTAGQGSRFPSPSAGDWFLATIDNGSELEIIKVTARSTDSFSTIARAQEGTTARAWSNGTRVEIRITKETLEALQSGAPSGPAGGDLTGSTYPNPTVANDAITNAKLANMAVDTVKGRATSGTGDPEDIPLTAAGRALIDDSSASAQRTTLGLGSIAVENVAAGGDLAGNWPSPTVAKIHETGGPTALTLATIADGDFLKRSGSTVVGASVVGGGGGGGGAPDNADYWVETANANLSSEVVVGSTGITKGAYASRQAAAKAGRLFLPSDGFLLERDNGSSWDPYGPYNFPLTPPVDGDFAWINQGSATVDTTNGGIYLLTPADVGTGVNFRIRKKAKSAPYTITAEFEPHLYCVTTHAFGLIFRQSSDGKLHTLHFQQSGNVVNVYSAKYTDATTFNAVYSGFPVVLFGFPRFCRIADNNTNRVLSWSNDGQHFHILHTIGRTDFLTADEVGFFVQSANTTWPAATLLTSWKEGS